ncbi:unnamed protein product, partial [Mesorhabditis belari]|uniref:Hepcidin n=1 Tax=Mesorhabditis belari TaxID=2138241 RepID=A0A915GN50_9BILA
MKLLVLILCVTMVFAMLAVSVSTHPMEEEKLDTTPYQPKLRSTRDTWGGINSRGQSYCNTCSNCRGGGCCAYIC